MSARTRKAFSPAKRVKRTAVSGGISPLVWLGLLGLGGLALFKSRTASAATFPSLPGSAPAQPAGAIGLPIQAGTQNIPELPGEKAPTASQVQSAGPFWDTLTPGTGPSSGYINFPSGTQAAAALFQVRNDGYGSPYVQWAGLTWILTGPDASGNYTATQVMTG
jgi:hypothetical protein